jgi:uncharacterized hydrophobic protein (TIGR00271 family)
MTAMPVLAKSEPFFRPLQEIYQDCDEGRQFNAMYLAMLVFACLISLFGLLLNSPAVIIGAMLISPLMGPILSCGLALTLADWKLGGKAIRNLALSLGEVVAIAALATFLSPLKEPTAEILARTNPNLMDLLVALFSGFAGTLALASRSRGALTIIPGVAIATAVMPPLATVGFGIAAGEWSISAGALMLFLTNLGAIVLSAAIVFIVVGFRPRKREDAKAYRLALRIAVAALVLIALSVPLVRTLVRAAQQTTLHHDVGEALQSEFSGNNRKLDDFSVSQNHDAISVNVSVHTASFIRPDEVKRYEKELSQRIHRPVHLNLLQLQIATAKMTEIAAQKDFLRGGVRSQPEPELSPTQATAQAQRDVQQLLAQLLTNSSVSSIQIDAVAIGADGQFQAEVSAQSKAPGGPDLWNVTAAALAQKLKAAVKLTGKAAILGTQLTLRYPAQSVRPLLADRKKALQFVKANSDDGIEYELLAQSGDELAGKRIDWLRNYLKIKSTPSTTPDWDEADNQIILRAVQPIEADASAPAPEPKVAQ